MLTVEEALAIVLEAAVPQEIEEVSFRQAVGRALSRDVAASEELPPFDRSAMDGYALRSADVPVGGAVLDVAGEVRAGRPGDLPLEEGQAIRIMTGAPIPPGADAVQMIERTEAIEGGRKVRIRMPVLPGENIRRRGEDVSAGAVVLRAGSTIRSAEVALLASLGLIEAPARRCPSVALLSTGDEIVEPDHSPLPHQIRSSNVYALEAILRDLGLPVEHLGIAADEPEPLGAAIRKGLAADVLCLTGGVSVGEYDLVEEGLRAEGVEILFHRVAVKPGKPLLFGRRGGSLVFGLPGNPVSCVCDFSLFVVPALRKMLGYADPRHQEVSGVLEEDVRQKPGREWYCLARADWRDGSYRVRPVLSRGSADLVAACRANAFLIVPQEADLLPAGSPARLLLWSKGF